MSNPIPPGAVITPAFIPAVPAGKRSYILGMGELEEKGGAEDGYWEVGLIVTFPIIVITLAVTSPAGKNFI